MKRSTFGHVSERLRQTRAMKNTLTLLTALLLAPLAAPMNFQRLETVRLQSSKHWN